MNKKVLLTLIAVILVAAGAYLLAIQEQTPKEIVIDPANVVTKTVNMSGMTCEACEIAIEKVSENDGVVKIKASSPNQTAIVEFDKTQTNIETIMKAIEMKGFKPVSYKDEDGLHELTPAKSEAPKHEMKCGAGKCGNAGKCGAE